MPSRRRFFECSLAAAAGLVEGCQAERAPPGRTLVRLWFSYGGKNRQVLEELVARFNARSAGDFVRAVFQGDYYEGLAKLRTALAAHGAPALSHVVGEVVPYLAAAGVLEPLAGYPGAHDLGVVPELGQDKSWLGGAQRPLVALPFNRSTPIAYLNAELFQRARLEPPRTWLELANASRELTTRRGERRYGFGCPIDWWFWVALVGQAGGRVVEEDGRVSLGGSAGVEALELWQGLVRERVMKPPPGRDYNAWEQTNQDFLAGRVAMIWSSTAFLKYLEEHARFRVLAAPLPGYRQRAVPTGGTHWVILRDAPGAEKAAAWRFLRFMHEPEQVIAWSTRTGYIPVTESAIARLTQEGYYAQHPNDRVALEQLSVCMPWPWSVELFRIAREIVQPELERAIVSQSSARELLARARERATRELG